MTKHGRIDILQAFSFDDVEGGLGGYADIAGRAVYRELRGRRLKFCGYEDLLTMKRAAGRPVDEIDVKSLKQARREL